MKTEVSADSGEYPSHFFSYGVGNHSGKRIFGQLPADSTDFFLRWFHEALVIGARLLASRREFGILRFFAVCEYARPTGQALMKPGPSQTASSLIRLNPTKSE
jgi:hypothetical protein